MSLVAHKMREIQIHNRLTSGEVFTQGRPNLHHIIVPANIISIYLYDLLFLRASRHHLTGLPIGMPFRGIDPGTTLWYRPGAVPGGCPMGIHSGSLRKICFVSLALIGWLQHNERASSYEAYRPNTRLSYSPACTGTLSKDVAVGDNEEISLSRDRCRKRDVDRCHLGSAGEIST